MENGFFSFVEDIEKKNNLLLLSAANARKIKAEETKQDVTKLEETLVSLKKKQKKYRSYIGTVAHHLYGCFIFIQILLVFVFSVKVTHTGGAPIWIQAFLRDFSPYLLQESQIGFHFCRE